jgi:hypothetical protein
MKKIIFSILFLFVFSNAKSQIITEIGQYSGVSVSSIYYDDDSDNGIYAYDYSGRRFTKNLIAISSGFQISYFKHKSWHLNSRLSYIERGGSERRNIVDEFGVKTGARQLNTFVLNNLCINTSFEYKYSAKYFSPYIFIGPRFDYIISSNYVLADENSSLKRYGLDFDFGLGIDRCFNDKYILGLDFSYNHQSHYTRHLHSHVHYNPEKCISILLSLGLKFDKK